MSRKVTLLPEEMQNSPVEQQVYYMAGMLARELESLHYHVEEVEGTLKGGPDQQSNPGFASLQDFHRQLRDRGAVGAVEWAQNRRRVEGRLALWVVLQGLLFVGAIAFALLRTGAA